MKIVTYDCEVYYDDWAVVFKEMDTGNFTVIHNDNEALKNCINEDTIYIGFNSKHYDQYIIKGICADFSTREVKKINDWIIAGNQGWQYPELKGFYFNFNNADIRDDMQQGLSLKAIEGHMGMNIKETDVDFNIERPLTQEELELTIKYCKHDVNATEELIKLRKSYLSNKLNLGKMAGLSEAKALSMTNAKLTAAMLQATAKPHDDERMYEIPNNLLREFIPQEVFTFFNRMYDREIPDAECFSEKLEITIGECPVTIGFGGIHGAIPNYIWEESEDGRIIRNKDVGSYYPHLCVINGYTSRNIPSPKIYENVLSERMKAKAEGDKAKADALKLVCNTTYGCLLNQYNDLYDPLMGRSVCISGQLYLLELAEHLYKDVPDLKIVQLNTDGIMVEFHKDHYTIFDSITKEWEERTHFDLEEDTVIKLAQKDVNNYVEVQGDGSVKCKGGYLVKGTSNAGAWKINNSCCIVATALKEYFVNGTPVEETINNCDDVFQYQIIAKAGAKYKEAYHIVCEEKCAVQKVNRVYATADERYGKLYKVKEADDSEAKIDSLPEHCLIDNDNQISIEAIDKAFYINMARKRVNDFKGIKPEKKSRRKKDMATTKTTKEPMNVYQKLIEARSKFLNGGVEKSGKNMSVGFKYFELTDIVPTVTNIFKELGLLGVTNFDKELAVMSIINCEDPLEKIEFTAPFNQIAPIVSNAGKQVTNEMQALGSSITYMRRYLYMIAMDIVENDEIEPMIQNDTSAPTKAPATVEQRQEVKQELTAPAENASDLQIKGLKKVLKELKDKDPSKEDLIAEIAVKTQGFTVISKADCETLINKISAMLGIE